MHYKTITLELIQEIPDLYEQLRSSKRLLPVIDDYATGLKASHEQWKAQITLTPGSDPSQIASEALELAIVDLRNRLRSAYPTDDSELFSLDDAMTFIRQATPIA